MTIGFILAGGIGERFGATIPKQYMSLNGKYVIQYAIDSLYESKSVDKIVVVYPEGPMPPLKNVDDYIIGGKTRFDSVLNALKYCPEETDIVLFHDAVRPFVPSEHFRKAIDIIRTSNTEYVVTAQKVTDGLFKGSHNNIEEGVDRSEYKLCQTPEVARFSSLKQLYLESENEIEARSINYICQLYDITNAIGVYLELPSTNLKITYDYDLFTAEQLTKYARPDKSPNPNLEGKRILLLGSTGDIGNALKTHLECLGAIVGCPKREIVNIEKLNKMTLDCLEFKYDCVINCAGIYQKDNNNYYDGLKKILKTNFTGVVKLIDICKNYWLKDGGNIILLGSASASYGRKGISAYSASKAALNTFVESVKDKLLENQIKVNVICPARVKGKLQQTLNPNANQEEMIDPKDLAKIITNYVITEETGQIVYLRNGEKND